MGWDDRHSARSGLGPLVILDWEKDYEEIKRVEGARRRNVIRKANRAIAFQLDYGVRPQDVRIKMPFSLPDRTEGICKTCTNPYDRHYPEQVRCDRCLAERHRDRRLRRESQKAKKASARTIRRQISRSLREKIYKRDGYRCLKCGNADLALLSLDHHLAITHGGTNHESNLFTLCKSCNNKKGAKKVKGPHGYPFHRSNQ